MGPEPEWRGVAVECNSVVQVGVTNSYVSLSYTRKFQEQEAKIKGIIKQVFCLVLPFLMSLLRVNPSWETICVSYHIFKTLLVLSVHEHIAKDHPCVKTNEPVNHIVKTLLLLESKWTCHHIQPLFQDHIFKTLLLLNVNEPVTTYHLYFKKTSLKPCTCLI